MRLMPAVHGHKTSIKFVGKRNSHPQDHHPSKHILKFEETKSNSPPKIYFTPESLSVSPTSNLKMRPVLTNEEISHINTGGPELIPNWTKIKIVSKMRV
jgi:hypothetical protein